ncbi:MAG: AAA family ATPase, partial [Actinomycetota bacterium]|nr:AAA family ATPase [Actinomycetota bacterium]
MTGAVFLKSLSLKGFKSFADPTLMHLEPGVTVVVGPNGSGKSNVVDAIAWVLGAQAPSAVRSQKMDDVIFAGTATRPALGRAEVSLTIDNSAGLLGLEFTEITVSRILFRTGESEYAINGVPCRLLDVQELLSDAGVGRQQHVIVSQGQIDAVLNARPEDRRGIVEEAAGVLKFRKRKEKAERRLASTEASLLRLNDLIREVRRQLKPLQRQADSARRHGDLMQELTAVRVYVAGRQVAQYRTALAGHTAAREQLQRNEADLRAELVRFDSEVLTLEAELSVRNTGDLSDRLIRVEQLRGRTRGVLALIAERRRGVERDRGRVLDEGLIATLEHDLAELRIEIATVGTRLERMVPEAEQLSTDEQLFANERQGLFVALDADPAAAASKAAAEMRGELRSLRTGFVRVEAAHRRAADRHDQLAASVVDRRVEVERRRQDLETIEASRPALETELDKAGAALGVAEMAEAVAAGERDDATTAAARWLARIEALQLALDAARSRTGAESLAGVDDVLGALLDLVEIDQGWELAAEAALGDAFEAVVVGGDDVARAAATALRAANAGGIVLSLDAAMLPRPPAELPGRPVRPHVQRRSGVHKGVDGLLDRLLAGAVRVDSFDDALHAASTDPELLVVTESGDRFGDT